MWHQIEQALNQSAARLLTGAAQLLPGTLALLLAVLVGAAVGWLFSAFLRRLLLSLDFDHRVRDTGWSEFGAWTESNSPTVLASRLAYWATVLLGFLIGLAAFDPTLTSQLVLRLFGSVMNLVTALVLLAAGQVLARFLSRGVLITLVNLNVEQARLVSLGVKWLVLVMAAAMALDHLSIGGRIVELAFGILFGGIVLTLSLMVGLRSKEIAHWPLAQPPAMPPPDDRGEPLRHL